MPLKFTSFQFTATFVWANDLSVIPLIGPRDVLVTTFHLRQPCGKKNTSGYRQRLGRKTVYPTKGNLLDYFTSTTTTPCANWHETMHYITNYPIPVPVYCWPAHHTTHTHTHTHTPICACLRRKLLNFNKEFCNKFCCRIFRDKMTCRILKIYISNCEYEKSCGYMWI